MKKPLILLTAMLMSVACLGQSMPTTQNQLDLNPDQIKKLSDYATSSKCDTCSAYGFFYKSVTPTPITFIEPTTNYWTIRNSYSLSVNGDGKELMQVTDRDPKTGEFKVWVNRKRMVWTSDSTFILLSKPKK